MSVVLKNCEWNVQYTGVCSVFETLGPVQWIVAEIIDRVF